MTRSKILKFLQFIHLIVFLSGSIIITLLHIYTKDFWDFLRIPNLLKEINTFLGHGWPASLHVYQAILLLSLFLALINALGLFLYKLKLWRYVSDISSFIGFLIIWPVTLFLAFTLVSVENLSDKNIQTILTYFVFSFLIFLLDLITWYFDDNSLIRYKISHK